MTHLFYLQTRNYNFKPLSVVWQSYLFVYLFLKDLTLLLNPDQAAKNSSEAWSLPGVIAHALGDEVGKLTGLLAHQLPLGCVEALLLLREESCV